MDKMELVDAAANGDIQELTKLLKIRPVVAEFGVQALIVASQEGHANCVSELIKADIDINQMDNDDMTALTYACENGHLECVQLLISAGGNEELRKDTLLYFGMNGLVMAAQSGHMECLLWLLNAGVNVNGSNNEGKTPLVGACIGGHPDCVDVLIKVGADVNLKTSSDLLISQTTALISAAELGHLECMDLLMRAGADVNMKNGMSSTALISAVFGSHAECVRYLIQVPNIDLNATGSSDYPAIFEAIKFHHLECLEILLKCEKFDVDVRGRRGETILMYGIKSSRRYASDYIKLILGISQVDINATDVLGKTALVYAVEYGNLECVRLLLKVDGVNVNVQYFDHNCDCARSSPLGAACNNGDSLIVLALLKAGARIESILSRIRRSPLMLVASAGNVQYTRSLLQSGFSVIECDDVNKNSLYFAARSGHVECLKVLLEAVSDDEKTCSSMRNLFLESARKSKIFDCLPILLNAGIFQWDWYPDFYEIALRSLTKVLVVNSFPPENFKLYIFGRLRKSSPLRFAFIKGDKGLIRYLLASMYLTVYDFHHFQKNDWLWDYLSGSKYTEVRALYDNLYRNPWRLETLSFLTVSTVLRKGIGQNRGEVINNSKLHYLLPQKIQKRLAFINQYQWLDIKEWDNIPVNGFKLDLRGFSLSDPEPEDKSVKLKWVQKPGVNDHLIYFGP